MSSNAPGVFFVAVTLSLLAPARSPEQLWILHDACMIFHFISQTAAGSVAVVSKIFQHATSCHLFIMHLNAPQQLFFCHKLALLQSRPLHHAHHAKLATYCHIARIHEVPLIQHTFLTMHAAIHTSHYDKFDACTQAPIDIDTSKQETIPHLTPDINATSCCSAAR